MIRERIEGGYHPDWPGVQAHTVEFLKSMGAESLQDAIDKGIVQVSKRLRGTSPQ
jgi:hypothetical protein